MSEPSKVLAPGTLVLNTNKGRPMYNRIGVIVSLKAVGGSNNSKLYMIKESGIEYLSFDYEFTPLGKNIKKKDINDVTGIISL
jgi:hypothetical protein